ncbi:ras guanine nucleotide exchange factor domain-containing protein [Mycena metata]|uniref:Ras guanine nucleotide exchange factor domain-containing protein n=1 Tax=Mycena metata TaxID=1033252 RepID=A0AAD7H5I1_9AGAR|nr:ras guanine nucleotide exchange factor domain-containing protein [Mycena metata]
MLGAYPDFFQVNPDEQLFDIIQKQFEQAVAKPYSERYRIVSMIITWLPTVPPESNVLRLVEAFVANNPHIVLGDRTVIRRTLGHCSANSPPRRPEPPVEPMDFYDVAVALTILAANIFNKLRLCDYSAYERGEPSRFDDLIAMNEKLSLWVKDCILSQRDRDSRKLCVKRFNKVAQECRKLRNYNSMATIARVLDEKSKPLAYIPRTMDMLSKSTRESLKQLLAITDPYDNYREYRKQRGGDKSGCIPWLTVLLSDLKRDLLRYPSIVDHQPELINIERYRKLAQRIQMYRMPADLERRRRGAHVTFLEAKFSNINFPDADEEGEVLRLLKLKEEEEKESKGHTLELRKLGFRA